MHCTCRTLLSGVFSAPPLSRATIANLPPSFLLPAFAPTQTSTFSTTSSCAARKDGNPRRGVSALHRTGLRRSGIGLSVKLKNLPKPVLDPSKRSKIEVDQDHGLWDFFPADRTAMPTPGELTAHGVGWSVSQLRNKDWDDLHRLWWVCLKELNALHTWTLERQRGGDMYGDYESEGRKREVKKTMSAIKATLTERWYAWDNARYAAMNDPEINMYADLDAGEPAFLPKEELQEEPTSASQDSLPSPQDAGETWAPGKEARN